MKKYCNMFSQVKVELFWSVIFFCKIFIFLIGQRLNQAVRTHISCKKFGYHKYCKWCETKKRFDNDFIFYTDICNFIFSTSTVLVCIYYVFTILNFFAQFVPISLIYVFSIGSYDPVLKFCLPEWMEPIYMGQL